MFGTIMTVIVIGYVGYYSYNIIHDLYFRNSGEIVSTEKVEETEVDIKDELQEFTPYEAKADLENKAEDNDNLQGGENITMAGGIAPEKWQNIFSSLENKGEDSDFGIVCNAITSI